MKEENVFLLPGEYIISKKPHKVTTLLGSCVAVCLYSRQARFGGINHYLLPTTNTSERSAKYGDYAIQNLIQFIERGAGSLKDTEAMVFGGASVVKTLRSKNNIGDKNVEMARTMLREYGIPITQEQVGGNTGMKIVYQTWDNAIQWRYIERS